MQERADAASLRAEEAVRRAAEMEDLTFEADATRAASNDDAQRLSASPPRRRSAPWSAPPPWPSRRWSPCRAPRLPPLVQ